MVRGGEHELMQREEVVAGDVASGSMTTRATRFFLGGPSLLGLSAYTSIFHA